MKWGEGIDKISEHAAENANKTFLKLEIKLCRVFKQTYVYGQLIKPLTNINFPEITSRHTTIITVIAFIVIAFHSFAWQNQPVIFNPNKNDVLV